MTARWSTVAVVLSMVVASICQAAPGSGIRLNQWMISPSASGSATYDSNVLLTENDEESDTFLEGVVSLDVMYLGEKLTAACRFFGISRSFSDQNALDYSSAGESFRVEFRRPTGLTIQADQSYRVVEDLDRSGLSPAPGDVSAVASPVASLTAAERSRRELLNGGVKVSSEVTDKVDASLAYAYAKVDYDLDYLFDSSEHVGMAEGGYRVTDKSLAIVTLQYGLQDSDAFSKDTDFAAARVGFRSRGTDKLQYNGGIGWQSYMRADDSAGDDVSGPSVNIVGQWQMTPKVAVYGGARNDITASSQYRDNIRKTSSAWLGLNCKPVASIEGVVSAAYSNEKHEDSVDVGGVMKTPKNDAGTITARVTYTAPVPFISLFAEASYAKVDSNIQDYDETRAGAGVTVRY